MRSLRSLLSIGIVAILAASVASAQPSNPKKPARPAEAQQGQVAAQQQNDVEPQIVFHKQLKPFIDRYGWRRADHEISRSCTPGGAIVQQTPGNVWFCRDYTGKDGSKSRILFKFDEGNRVHKIFQVVDGEFRSMVEFSGNRVTVDRTGTVNPSQPETAIAQNESQKQGEDPTKALSEAAKGLGEAFKGLGGLIKR